LGTISASIHNLIADGSCAGMLSGDPLLAPLADYGGDTQTTALLPGSPAIDAGASAACPATDQRGVARPGDACDIGAFESQGFALNIDGGTPQTTTVASAFAAPLEVTVVSPAGEPVGPGGAVVFTPPASGPGISTGAPFTLPTSAGGAVSYAASANNLGGAYTVIADVRGAYAPAIFSLTNLPLYLSVTTIGGGSVTSVPAAIDCGTVCTAALDYGVQLTLTAAADAGYTFVNWTENGVEVATGAIYSFTAVTNRTLVANFAAEPLPDEKLRLYLPFLIQQ
jgi:hypothetical protein